MLYLFPDLVRIGEHDHFQPRRTFHHYDVERHGEPISFGLAQSRISQNFGALGDSTRANAEISLAMFNEVVAILCKLASQLLDTKLEQALRLLAVHASDEGVR